MFEVHSEPLCLCSACIVDSTGGCRHKGVKFLFLGIEIIKHICVAFIDFCGVYLVFHVNCSWKTQNIQNSNEMYNGDGEYFVITVFVSLFVALAYDALRQVENMGVV